MSKMYSTSLISTPWPFWTVTLSQVSKNDDEKTLLLRVIWLYLNDLINSFQSDASTVTGIEMWTEHSGLINYAYNANTGYDKTVSMTSIVELTAGEEVMF